VLAIAVVLVVLLGQDLAQAPIERRLDVAHESSEAAMVMPALYCSSSTAASPRAGRSADSSACGKGAIMSPQAVMPCRILSTFEPAGTRRLNAVVERLSAEQQAWAYQIATPGCPPPAGPAAAPS
jgi:hypothetical protein